ncbi:MAG TPA: hypothetical protein VM537_31930 [Anaerolineae bacterium]|nr:hypothetical protein [Anaerolineae bacterium]
MMADELVEHLAEKMHHEWLEVMAEQRYHARPSKIVPGKSFACGKCRDGLVPWGLVPEEVREVNRRGVRRILRELGLDKVQPTGGEEVQGG